MELTNNNRGVNILLVVMVLFFQGPVLCAQDARQAPAPGQLGVEIRNLEQKLSLSAISVMERHEALVRLAYLRQLSGNIAGAAANWLDAVAVNPRDDTALISGAYCLAAIGEWEKAALTLRPLLDSNMLGLTMLQARYLDAFLRARSSGDMSVLVDLAGDSAFAPLHAMIYYTLWQIIVLHSGSNTSTARNSEAERWKSRLLDEYPQSPEARVARAENDRSVPAMSVVQSPLWLLFPESHASSLVESALLSETVPPAGIVLQTGLFGREANARAHADALQKAGFSASITPRTVNGVNHWVVTVPGGQDSNQTIRTLKAAGFDSFPVSAR